MATGKSGDRLILGMFIFRSTFSIDFRVGNLDLGTCKGDSIAFDGDRKILSEATLGVEGGLDLLEFLVVEFLELVLLEVGVNRFLY